MFKDKILLITGGTGSFGKTVLSKFLNSNIQEIRIFSRDEKKQDDIRKYYNNSKIKFFIGDVRDPYSLEYAMKDVNYVFHAAALKQVPSCEFYPLEAVKTNIIGTENVLNVSIKYNIEKIIILSTDKAIYPINAMGISKAMMEKVAIAKSRISGNTIVNITRYGNVMNSRGSAIPLFVNQIKSGLPITITDPEMTRFMMSLDDAVQLVLFAFEHGRSGEIFVQKSPAVTISTLVDTLKEIYNKPNHPIEIIGTRHGEKLYETLLSREEMFVSEDLGEYYKIAPDLRDLNYQKYIDSGNIQVSNANEFNSHNTTRLNIKTMKSLLSKIDL